VLPELVLAGELAPGHLPGDEPQALAQQDPGQVLPVGTLVTARLVLGVAVVEGLQADLAGGGELEVEVPGAAPLHLLDAPDELVVDVGIGAALGRQIRVEAGGPPLPLQLVVGEVAPVGAGDEVAEGLSAQLRPVPDREAEVDVGRGRALLGAEAGERGVEGGVGERLPQPLPHGGIRGEPLSVQTADLAHQVVGQVPGAVVDAEEVQAAAVVAQEAVGELALGVQAAPHRHLEGQAVGELPGVDLHGAAGEVAALVRRVGLPGGDALDEAGGEEVERDHRLLGLGAGQRRAVQLCLAVALALLRRDRRGDAPRGESREGEGGREGAGEEAAHAVSSHVLCPSLRSGRLVSNGKGEAIVEIACCFGLVRDGSSRVAWMVPGGDDAGVRTA